MSPIIFFILALFLPETMLISQIQILRVKKMYEDIKPIEEQKKSVIPEFLRFENKVQEYSKMIKESGILTDS